VQNEIQRGGLNRILYRTLTIKGDVPPAPLIGAEIVPTMPLEVDRPEWGFLAGERRCWAEASLFNVAGQVCKVVLENPAGSGIFLVIERLTLYTGNSPSNGPLSAIVHYGDPDTPADGIGGMMAMNATGNQPGLARDFRWGQKNVVINYNLALSAARMLTGTSGIGMGGFFAGDVCTPIFVQSGFIPERIPEFILPPGWKIGVEGSVNTALCALFAWRERNMEPQEIAASRPV